MATVPMKYDMVRDGLVGADFIEDPGLDVLMRVEPNGVIRIKGQFIEATRSYETTGYVDSPDNYSLTVWWRAEDLTGFSEGDQITIDTASWFSHDNTYSASQASGLGAPQYTEAAFADNKPSVNIKSNENDTLRMSSTFDLTGSTVSVLLKDDATDGMVLGNAVSNIQMRRYRSGVNTISAYWGASDIVSNALSSSAAQAVVLTWVFGTGNPVSCAWYENKYTRGAASLGLGAVSGPHNWIGRTSYGQAFSGSIAEICIWSGSLDTGSLQSLFDNYWKTKYSGDTFYEA